MTSRLRSAQGKSSFLPIPRGNKADDVEFQVYLTQDDVLKPTTPGVDQDNFPVYLLEAATVYSLDGERIENLLNVEVKGRVEVRGRLTISSDEEEISHLRTPQHNGQWIAFQCHAFSIGWGPSVIWAMGDRKWFEIQPSLEYKATYAKITEGIAAYYYLTELYEQLANNLAQYPIDTVFLLYAELEGSNLSTDDIRQRVMNHASFLLTQMAKMAGNVKWPNTRIFKWLTAECPEIHNAILKKTYIMPTPIPVPIPVSTPVPPPVHVPKPPRQSSIPKGSVDSNSAPIAEIERRHIITNGAPSTVEMIIRVIQELVKERQAPDKITIATVWTVLYHDLQIELPQARAILRCHSKQVLDSLDHKVWGNYQIYKDLAIEAALSDPSSKEFREQARILAKLPKKERSSHPSVSRAKDFAEYGATAKTIILKPRKSAGDRRRPVKKNPISSTAARDATGDKKLISPSPETEPETRRPHGAKAIPSLHRGKNAILRPTSTTTSQYSTDASSGRSIKADHGSLGGIGGRGKKRKSIAPELGDVSDDETMWDAMDGVLQREIRDDVSEEDDLELTLVDIQLPSTEPTGPSGSWVCSRPDCSVNVHDSSSEEGQLAIRNHIFSHADSMAMQYLVETESKNHGGIETKYLLEKIRQIGASKRVEDEAEQAGKLQTVKPIKRADV